MQIFILEITEHVSHNYDNNTAHKLNAFGLLLLLSNLTEKEMPEIIASQLWPVRSFSCSSDLNLVDTGCEELCTRRCTKQACSSHH